MPTIYIGLRQLTDIRYYSLCGTIWLLNTLEGGRHGYESAQIAMSKYRKCLYGKDQNQRQGH